MSVMQEDTQTEWFVFIGMATQDLQIPNHHPLLVPELSMQIKVNQNEKQNCPTNKSA